jgi:AraC family transcriptional regulator, regulatory protein of adaptative response / methylated-DNA-[protein]-cysteine methyltransferase
MNIPEQERWQAILRRDATYDGEFVFGVKTTGIFCRASCPARKPKPENIVFYETTDAAIEAGFRACLRCKPLSVSHEQRRIAMIERACVLIRDADTRLTLDEVAAQVDMSPHHFHRVFRSVTGVTPKDYQVMITKSRMECALRKPQSMTDAMLDAGFASSSRFYESAPALLGMSPKNFRAGGDGERIRMAAVPSALGVLLIAATHKGICALEFGDSAHALQARLKERFQNAIFIEGDDEFNQWIAQTTAHIKQPSSVLDMPLDIQGTVFQQQVWKALREIPLATTQSYLEVATRIGKPKSVRAVANACGANKIAVVIPCHRVIASDGSSGGYRWGVARKASLLASEARAKIRVKTRAGAKN